MIFSLTLSSSLEIFGLGLNTARPQLHKLRLSQPSDPTSGLVPVHSWMLSALRSLKLYSVPRSSFIAVLGPPKMDVGRLEMGKLAGLVGFEGDKEYVWVAENDVRRGEFLRKLWAAVPPDTKRKVRLEGTDSDFGLPPETKSEREREREARKERERERELLRSQSEVAEEKETVDVPESQPDLARAQTAPAAPNLKATPPSPISTAKELLHPSPLSARSSSLPGEFVSPNNLAPRSASLRAGNTPTSHPTPMALAPWDDPDAPPESYDFNLLLSAADRLLARQHLLPTSLPPDLDLILSSFDFRIGGDARELERRVQDEIDGLERGNAWALLHVHMEHESIGTAVARAAEALQRVEEEHLDPYARVLVGMGADVRAIEARNRTGGVVGDNMDKLLTETRRLLSKLRLPEGLLETLRTADLADPGGRERALGFAHALLKRMAGPWEGMDQMRAVREQRNDWAGAAAVFAARVGRQIAGEADRAVSFAATAGRVDKGAPKFPALAGALQGYRGLLNWVREADPRGHYEILGGYADRLAKIWDSEVKRWIGECKGTIGGRTGNYCAWRGLVCLAFWGDSF